MKRITAVFSAVILSCFVAVLLHLISTVLTASSGQSASTAVLSLNYGTELNDQNLVDYMARMSLRVGIRKLDWQEPVLYADFYALDHLQREELFADIQHLLLFGLSSMRNVDKMMIRLYDGEAKHASLLLAIMAEREQVQKVMEEISGEETSEFFVRRSSGVQFAPRWSGWVE